MVCPKCKAQVQDGSKFCQNCGQKLEQPQQQPKYKQESKFVRIVKPIVIVFLCFVAYSIRYGGFIEIGHPNATATPTVQATATATRKPTATPKPSATPKPTKTVKTLEQAMEEIRVELSDYDFCEVFLDDDYIIVDIASEGLTTIAGLVIAEPTEPAMQMWEQIKQSTIDLSKAINKSNAENGVSNRCVIRLISEVDTDTILLSVSNDLVLFDVVNQ